MSKLYNYEVKLVKGGPLSGPRLNKVYQPGEVVSYGPGDAEYIETVIKRSGRFQVIEKEIKQSTPSKPEPKAPEAPKEPQPPADYTPKPKGRKSGKDK